MAVKYNEKMQFLMEQLILEKQNRFGRSSEKMYDTSQISFREVDGTIVFFNEAEAVCDLHGSEPENLELKSSKPAKRKGKKEADLSGLAVKRIDHCLTWNWKQNSAAIDGNSYRMSFLKISFRACKDGSERTPRWCICQQTDKHMVKAEHGKLVHPSRRGIFIGSL